MQEQMLRLQPEVACKTSLEDYNYQSSAFESNKKALEILILRAWKVCLISTASLSNRRRDPTPHPRLEASDLPVWVYASSKMRALRSA